jgi:hypothetical protein
MQAMIEKMKKDQKFAHEILAQNLAVIKKSQAKKNMFFRKSTKFCTFFCFYQHEGGWTHEWKYMKNLENRRLETAKTSWEKLW